MDIRILQLEYLMEPMDQLYVRIPPQLAENGRTLDCFVAQAVEFPEKRCPIDICHVRTLSLVPYSEQLDYRTLFNYLQQICQFCQPFSA